MKKIDVIWFGILSLNGTTRIGDVERTRSKVEQVVQDVLMPDVENVGAFELVEMVEPEPLLARCLTRLLINRTSETSSSVDGTWPSDFKREGGSHFEQKKGNAIR